MKYYSYFVWQLNLTLSTSALMLIIQNSFTQYLAIAVGSWFEVVLVGIPLLALVNRCVHGDDISTLIWFIIFTSFQLITISINIFITATQLPVTSSKPL